MRLLPEDRAVKCLSDIKMSSVSSRLSQKSEIFTSYRFRSATNVANEGSLSPVSNRSTHPGPKTSFFSTSSFEKPAACRKAVSLFHREAKARSEEHTAELQA